MAGIVGIKSDGVGALGAHASCDSLALGSQACAECCSLAIGNNVHACCNQIAIGDCATSDVRVGCYNLSTLGGLGDLVCNGCYCCCFTSDCCGWRVPKTGIYRIAAYGGGGGGGGGAGGTVCGIGRCGGTGPTMGCGVAGGTIDTNRGNGCNGCNGCVTICF